MDSFSSPSVILSEGELLNSFGNQENLYLPDINSNINARNIDITCNTLQPVELIKRYDGYALFNRLIYICKNCSNLRQQAIDLLLVYCYDHLNIPAYQLVHEIASKYGIHLQLNTEWIESTERKIRMKLDELQLELATVKSSMIHESIRMSYFDLGFFYQEIGNFNEAIKIFSKAQGYCSTARHRAELNSSLYTIYLFQGYFHMISTNQSVSESNDENPEKLRLLSALGSLYNGQYRQAAINLLSIDFQNANSLVLQQLKQIVSFDDILFYTILSTILSFPVCEVKQKTINSKSFRALIELSSQSTHPSISGNYLKQFLQNFLTRKYQLSFEYYLTIKNEMKLDFILSSRVDEIQKSLQENTLVQYIQPYSCIFLEKISREFHISPDELEDMLSQLISSSKLNSYRINMEKNILVRVEINVPLQTFRNIQKMHSKYINDIKSGLMRLAIVKNNLFLNENQTQNNENWMNMKKFKRFSSGNAMDEDD